MKKCWMIVGLLSVVLAVLAPGVFAGEIRNGFYIEYDGRVVAYQTKTVSLEIDGNKIETGEMPAVIVDSSTLVPAREVFESDSIQATVEWVSETEEVHITYGDTDIILTIGADTAYVNSAPVKLEVPAKLIRDTSKSAAKTMIPLRFVIENLGFTVDWDGDSYTAKIFTPTESDTQMPEDDEDLEDIHSEEPINSLPTALADNPIIWSYEGEIEDSEDSEDESPEELAEEVHDAVEVTAISYASKSGKDQFVIETTGPITSVKQSMWANGYILDITNATSALIKSAMDFSDNPSVTAVRYSDQKPDAQGRPVLRIVFDLRNPDASDTLKMSNDRSSLILEFSSSTMTGVELGQDKNGDYLLLTGTISPTAVVTRLSDPDRIVFDIPGFINPMGTQTVDGVPGQYVIGMRLAQYDDSTTRVVVETDGQAEYSIKKLDDTTTKIQIMEPSYSNIDYVSQAKPLITLVSGSESINMDAITYEDNYNDYSYTIHLNGDYSNLLGTGSLNVSDDYIESIALVQNVNNDTDIVIKEKEIYVFKVEKAGEDIIIKAYKPKDLYKQIVVVDFGHGGTDPGAVNASVGVHEADLNLSIGNRLRKFLDADPSLKVYYTRPIDEFISLQGRTDLANSIEADFFLSIHNNSFLPHLTGTETIFFSDADRSGLNSVELAEIIHDHAAAAVGLNNRGIKDNNSLFVLRMTDMPAAIVECAFVSNETDVAHISKETVQQSLAQALYEGILEVFEKFPTGR